MRSLQLCLHRSWDRVDQSTWIPWSQDCLGDLRWWLHVPRISLGVSLQQVSPDLDFWSDASDFGWGAHLGLLTASGLWSLEESLLSINAREILAVRRGLLHFQSSLVGRTISVYCDNSTAVSYLRKERGTRSPFLNSLVQGILRWVESAWLPSSSRGLSMFCRTLYLALTGYHIQSGPSIRRSFDLLYKSSVAGPNRLVCNLRESPMLDLFLSLPGSDGSRHGRVPSTLGRSSGLRVSSLVHHSQGSGEAPGISGDRAHLGGSVLASASLVSRPPSPVAGPSSYSASTSRPPAPASVSQPLPGSPQAVSSCLETLRRFTRAAGFSSTVASQASLSRRPSSRKAYQLKWQVYRAWCHSHGHSVSRPSLSEVADFLCWLRSSRGLVFHLSEATVPCCLLCSDFIFHRCLLIRWSVTGSGPSALRQRNASFALLPGIFPWLCGF